MNAPTPPSTWTDERVALLLDLWANVESGSDVASKLGVTRSAALGKLLRLGKLGKRRPGAARRQASKPRLPSAPKPEKKPVWTWRRKKRPGKPSVPLAAVRPRPVAIPEPKPLGLSVLDLRDGFCKWPHGDPRHDFGGFCGHPAHGSYCPHHEQRAHRAG